LDPSLQVQAGEVLAGKYRIERVLGQGGMGVVVQATHIHLDERVAIKFLLPQALESPEAVARFAREARAAVKIKSEHVARVTDVGTLETGCPYMVMEYLHGRDLAQLVQDQGPLTIEHAVDFVLQASEAIAEAHSLGIVHRDLKPSNLFLIHRADGSPCVKVLDFGISKTTGMKGSGPDLGMTRTTAVMGSPLYMSPEQMASSRNVDQRTDIWALGAILFELLTGQVPFQADTMPQLCAMVLQEPAPPLRGRLPMAPEALEAAILRCLEKVPARRFNNVAEFANSIAAFAPRWGRVSVERISRILTAAGQHQVTPSSETLPSNPPLTAAAQTGKVAATQAAWDQSAPAPKRSRAPLIAAVLGVTAVALGGAALFGYSQFVATDATTPSAGPASQTAPVATADPPPAPTAPPPVVEVTRDPAPRPSAAPTASETAALPTQPAPKAKPGRPTAKKPPEKDPPKPATAATPPPPPPKPVSDLYSDRK
jgi:serine/threonine protein kinase